MSLRRSSALVTDRRSSSFLIWLPKVRHSRTTIIHRADNRDVMFKKLIETVISHSLQAFYERERVFWNIFKRLSRKCFVRIFLDARKCLFQKFGETADCSVS